MKLLIDNSSLSNLACERQFELAVLHGYTLPNNPGGPPDFGNAFHKCLEYLDKNIPVEEAIAKTFSDAPSVDQVKLLKTLVAIKTSTRHPPALTINNVPAVEYKFHIPNYYSCHLDDGQELVIDLAGTIDRVHFLPKENILEVIEYKTAVGATDHFVNKTRREYEMSFQLCFYLHALKHILPSEWAEYIHRGLYRLETYIAFYNLSSNQIKRTPRPPFPEDYLNIEIPAIIRQRLDRVADIANHYVRDVRAPMTGLTVRGMCLDCRFRNPCIVAHTNREKELLDRYDTRIYNPLEFR